MTEETIVVKKEDTILREEDGGAFIFDPESGDLKFLNLTGVAVLKMCESKRQVGDIVKSLWEAYKEVPEEQVRQDVFNFLESLLSSEFIQEVTN